MVCVAVAVVHSQTVSCLGARASRNNSVALIAIYLLLLLTLSSARVLLIGVSAAN